MTPNSQERGQVKHTPGPWHIVVPPHGSDEIRQNDEGNYLICEFPYGATDGVDAANARLIAAAPALLAALTACEQWLYDYNDATGTFDRIAAMYYRETGKMRPGKDRPALAGLPDSTDDDRFEFNRWCEKTHMRILAAARAAIALATGETK